MHTIVKWIQDASALPSVSQAIGQRRPHPHDQGRLDRDLVHTRAPPENTASPSRTPPPSRAAKWHPLSTSLTPTASPICLMPQVLRQKDWRRPFRRSFSRCGYSLSGSVSLIQDRSDVRARASWPRDSRSRIRAASAVLMCSVLHKSASVVSTEPQDGTTAKHQLRGQQNHSDREWRGRGLGASVEHNSRIAWLSSARPDVGSLLFQGG